MSARAPELESHAEAKFCQQQLDLLSEISTETNSELENQRENPLNEKSRLNRHDAMSKSIIYRLKHVPMPYTQKVNLRMSTRENLNRASQENER